MTAEGENGHLRWKKPGFEGYKAKGLCSVVCFPADAKETLSALSADAFTFDGSETIMGHRVLRPGAAPEADIESCKLCIAAAASVESGVTALAAAQGEGTETPLQVFVGLSNGQLWYLEVKQQQQKDEDHRQQEQLRLSAASKQLLCCRMAEPVDAACCYVRREGGGEEEAGEKSSSGSNGWSLMVIVLYSDGVAVASWPSEGHTTELPSVFYACTIHTILLLNP